MPVRPVPSMPKLAQEAGAWNGEDPGAVLGAANGDAAGLSFTIVGRNPHAA